MSPRPILLIAALMLGAAAPPTGPGAARPSAAQQAQFRALTEKLGACHRARAVAGAATKATAAQIARTAIAACQARVAPIRAALVDLVGDEQADRMLLVQRSHWQEAIARIVAAERAQR